MRRLRIVTISGGLLAVLAIAGCQSGSADQSHGAASSAAVPSASASSGAPAGGQAGTTTGRKIAIHVTLDDPVMGDHVQAGQLVRDFPVPASMSAVSDREIVLVDVTATAGSTYYAGWQSTQLAVVVDGQENQESETDDLDAAMTKAGYAPLGNNGSVDTGKTGSGWIPFVVDPKDAPKLTLRMKRVAASTSDGKSIPAKNFDAPMIG